MLLCFFFFVERNDIVPEEILVNNDPDHGKYEDDLYANIVCYD